MALNKLKQKAFNQKSQKSWKIKIFVLDAFKDSLGALNANFGLEFEI